MPSFRVNKKSDDSDATTAAIVATDELLLRRSLKLRLPPRLLLPLQLLPKLPHSLRMQKEVKPNVDA